MKLAAIHTLRPTAQREPNSVKRQLVSPHWIVSSAMVFGLVVGAVSSYVRPMISGPVHFEAIVSLLLLVMFFVVTLVISLATARPMLWTSVAIVLTWLAYFVGWSLVAQRMWDDMIGVCATGIVCSLTVALPLVFLLRRFQNLKAST